VGSWSTVPDDDAEVARPHAEDASGPPVRATGRIIRR
jgi:hypothetical protein